MPAAYVVKATEVEVWTFEEFVAYGDRIAESRGENGVPWSFEFKNRQITHDTDDRYLFSVSLEGRTAVARFDRGDMLVVAPDGAIFPCKPDVFEKTYEPKPTV